MTTLDQKKPPNPHKSKKVFGWFALFWKKFINVPMTEFERLLPPEDREVAVSLKLFSLKYEVSLEKIRRAVREQEILTELLFHKIPPYVKNDSGEYYVGWLVDAMIAKEVLTQEKVITLLRRIENRKQWDPIDRAYTGKRSRS